MTTYFKIFTVGLFASIMGLLAFIAANDIARRKSAPSPELTYLETCVSDLSLCNRMLEKSGQLIARCQTELAKQGNPDFTRKETF